MSKPRPQCPQCYTHLESRELAPCDDCGFDTQEVGHFHDQKHTYSQFHVYGSELVLCNFCDVDFSSYQPEFWGFKKGENVGYGSEGFRDLREIPYSELNLKKGWFCPSCNATLKFIEAALQARDANVE